MMTLSNVLNGASQIPVRKPVSAESATVSECGMRGGDNFEATGATKRAEASGVADGAGLQGAAVWTKTD